MSSSDGTGGSWRRGRSDERWVTAKGFSLAFLGGAALSGYRTAFAVQYPAMVQGTHWSTTELTLAFAIAMPMYAGSSIVAGIVADRSGVPLVMASGLALLSAATAAATLAEHSWEFILSYGVVAGIGLSGVGFPVILKGLMLMSGRRLGTALSGHQVGQGFAALLGAPLLGTISSAFGWRAGQIAIGLAFAVLIPFAFWSAPRRGRGDGAVADPRPLRRTGVDPLAMLAIACSLTLIGYWSLVPTHQVAHLLTAGFSYTTAATLTGVGGLMGMVGGLVAGRIIPSMRLSTFLVLASVVLGGGTFALAGSTPENASFLVPLFVVGTGLGRGALGLANGVLEGRLLPLDSAGRFSGFLEVALAIGSIAGPMAGAYSRDATGSFVPAILTAALASVASAGLGMLALRLGPSRSVPSVAQQRA